MSTEVLSDQFPVAEGLGKGEVAANGTGDGEAKPKAKAKSKGKPKANANVTTAASATTAVARASQAPPAAPKAINKLKRVKADKTASSGLPPDSTIRQAALLLKQSSDPTRLKVMLLLSSGEKNVGELCDVIGQSQPATSHHLALLRHGRLIEPRRSGKHNYYGLTEAGRKLINAVRAAL